MKRPQRWSDGATKARGQDRAEGSRTGVLFVCTANICRSPLAAGVFLHQAEALGVAGRFRVESAGTGAWRAGEPPDPRAVAVAARRGIVLSGRARQVERRDLDFDHLVCMDEFNRDALIEMGAPPLSVSLLLEHDPQTPLLEVPDPYGGGPDTFESIFRMIDSGCAGLLRELLGEGATNPTQRCISGGGSNPPPRTRASVGPEGRTERSI
jgi:protein-tyrosine phosphatase